jgi:hypothetical protein
MKFITDTPALTTAFLVESWMLIELPNLANPLTESEEPRLQQSKTLTDAMRANDLKLMLDAR